MPDKAKDMKLRMAELEAEMAMLKKQADLLKKKEAELRSSNDVVKIFIEAPSGERFEAEIPRDIKLSKLAADFFEDRGWPTQDQQGRGQRAVVELVNPGNPDDTKRLNGDLNIEDCNLRDGDTLRIFPESIAGCFLGQVTIALANGQRKLIRDIQVGDVLLSGIPNSKERTTTRVARIFKSVADNYLTLNGTLHVTESHPIWSNGKWVQAGKLKVGYKLQTITGNYVYIKSIDQHQSKVDVWNLFVTSDEHTFFADDVLVHNMSIKESIIKESIHELAYLQHIHNLEEKVNDLDFKLDQITRAFEALAKVLRRIVVFRKVETNVETNAIIQIQIASDVQSFDRDKQASLIGSIAAHTEIPKEKIKLINIIEGSVLVTLEMPEEAALKLIKLYLGGNSLVIRELGIEKIELRPLLSLPRAEVLQLASPEKKPIRILFLAANPLDTPQLRLGEEVRSIEQALRLAEFRDRYDIVQYWATRIIDLQGCLLRYRPDIVHFSGHGSSSGEIILEDELGNSDPVSTRALSSLFAVLKDNIRCVVLNACYSEPQALAIADQIDCVIGMSKSIRDPSAISFATAFYQALGYGRDLKTAFELGCTHIDLRNLNEQDVPKLLTIKSDPSKIQFVN